MNLAGRREEKSRRNRDLDRQNRMEISRKDQMETFICCAGLAHWSHESPRRPCGANPVWQPPNKSSSSQPKGWAGGGERGAWAGGRREELGSAGCRETARVRRLGRRRAARGRDDRRRLGGGGVGARPGAGKWKMKKGYASENILNKINRNFHSKNRILHLNEHRI